MRLLLTVTCLVILIYHPTAFANQDDGNESPSVWDSINQKQETKPAEVPDDSGAQRNDGLINEGTPSSPEGLSDQSTFIIFAKMLGALAFVIFLLYVILRFINNRTRSFRSSQWLQNVGGVPLGANRSVQLVKVGERLLVVGVGDSIQLLKEINDEQEIKQLMNQQQEQFSQMELPLNKVITWFNRRLRGEGSAHADFKPPPNQRNQEAFKELLSKQLTDVSKSQKQFHDAVRKRGQEK